MLAGHAQAEDAIENRSLLASVVGDQLAISIAGAETFDGILGLEGLELTAVSALPRITGSHSGGHFVHTDAQDDIEDMSGGTVVIGRHDIAGAESLCRILRGERLELDTRSTLQRIAGINHTSSDDLIEHVSIATGLINGVAIGLTQTEPVGGIQCSEGREVGQVLAPGGITGQLFVARA